MTDVILPRIPSDLIELALADLVKCERSPKYEIDMGQWYTPHEDGSCVVCLAGSVMAQNLGNGPDDLEPGDFPENEAQLNALDSFRKGNILNGFECLDEDFSDGRLFVPTNLRYITSYAVDPGKFKREMRKLARDLRAAGY